jgi:hypothetical protein
LIEWAADEGWNPGLSDATAFRSVDPDGMLGAFVDGELAAAISAIAYGPSFGFIGLYICRPDLRGRGYGKAVWDAGLARLEGRTIGLDGVPEQQANYSSAGFAVEHETVRFSGSLTSEQAPLTGVRPFTPDLLEPAMTLDRRCFPAPRDGFLRQWLAEPHIALALVRDGAFAGFGVARACREGSKIGPLFADDETVAKSLLCALAEACGGGVHIDVPATSASFAAWVEAAGLTPGFRTARMYRGPAPRVDRRRVFGVTTLELA